MIKDQKQTTEKHAVVAIGTTRGKKLRDELHTSTILQGDITNNTYSLSAHK